MGAHLSCGVLIDDPTSTSTTTSTASSICSSHSRSHSHSPIHQLNIKPNPNHSQTPNKVDGSNSSVVVGVDGCGSVVGVGEGTIAASSTCVDLSFGSTDSSGHKWSSRRSIGSASASVAPAPNALSPLAAIHKMNTNDISPTSTITTITSPEQVYTHHNQSASGSFIHYPTSTSSKTRQLKQQQQQQQQQPTEQFQHQFLQSISSVQSWKPDCQSSIEIDFTLRNKLVTSFTSSNLTTKIHVVQPHHHHRNSSTNYIQHIQQSISTKNSTNSSRASSPPLPVIYPVVNAPTLEPNAHAPIIAIVPRSTPVTPRAAKAAVQGSTTIDVVGTSNRLNMRESVDTTPGDNVMTALVSNTPVASISTIATTATATASATSTTKRPRVRSLRGPSSPLRSGIPHPAGSLLTPETETRSVLSFLRMTNAEAQAAAAGLVSGEQEGQEQGTMKSPGMKGTNPSRRRTM